MKPITDPALLAQLETPDNPADAIIAAIERDAGQPLSEAQRAQIRAGGDFNIAVPVQKPVTDPALLAALEAPQADFSGVTATVEHVPAAQTTSNPLMGALSRAAELGSGIVGGIANTSERLGDALSLRLPEWARGVGDLSDDVIREQNQLQPLFNLRDWLGRQAKDINYQPATTFEQVKEDPISLNTPTFIGEQVIRSVPDMAAAITALPAYVLGRTQEIGERRVELDNRTGDPTLTDLALSLIHI